MATKSRLNFKYKVIEHITGINKYFSQFENPHVYSVNDNNGDFSYWVIAEKGLKKAQLLKAVGEHEDIENFGSVKAAEKYRKERDEERKKYDEELDKERSKLKKLLLENFTEKEISILELEYAIVD